jgi:hypothetical protein
MWRCFSEVPAAIDCTEKMEAVKSATSYQAEIHLQSDEVMELAA